MWSFLKLGCVSRLSAVTKYLPRSGPMANGNGKKKKKKIILVSSGIAAAILAVLILIAAKSGGTVIDKSKIGEVKREKLAKNGLATGKITTITKTAIKSRANGIV